MNQSSIIRNGFILAGIVNIAGVLLFTQAFTSPVLAETYPAVFSDFGMIAIMLWGLAYIAMANHYQQVPWMAMVFFIEKMVYVISWVVWICADNTDLAMLLEQSPLQGLFFVIYGANDLLFGCVFLWAFLDARK